MIIFASFRVCFDSCIEFICELIEFESCKSSFYCFISYSDIKRDNFYGFVYDLSENIFVITSLAALIAYS